MSGIIQWACRVSMVVVGVAFFLIALDTVRQAIRWMVRHPRFWKERR